MKKQTLIIVLLSLMFIIGILYYYSVEQSIFDPKWKIININKSIKEGDCYEHKTIINITSYSKTKDKIYYTDGCKCEYLFETGGKGISFNVPISSDYMDFKQRENYAKFLANIFKSTLSPVKDFNYVFYSEIKSGDCMKPNNNPVYRCSPKIPVTTIYGPEEDGGSAAIYWGISLYSPKAKTKILVLHEFWHVFGIFDSQYRKYSQAYPTKLYPDELERVNHMVESYNKTYIKSLSCKITDEDYKLAVRQCHIEPIADENYFGINYKYNVDDTCIYDLCTKTGGTFTGIIYQMCTCPVNYKWVTSKGCIKQ